MTKAPREIQALTAALIVALSLTLSLVQSANAQYDSGGQYTTGLRTPLIQGAPNAAAGVAPQEGQAPPIGSGSTPVGVTPGMDGSPTLLPWITAIPANQIDQQNSEQSLSASPSTQSAPGDLRQQLTGQIPGPPSTPGSDPGMLPSMNGYGPAAALVNINAGGGMPGDQAPQTRRGGQTTSDFGLYRTSGSQLTDFGQKLSTVAVKTPQTSQDGPRQTRTPAMGQVNRAQNLQNAQTTQLLYGNRINYSPNGQARSTIAPY